MTGDWIARLKSLVQLRPIVALRIDAHDWTRLTESRRGTSEFSLVYPHELLENVKPPAVCLVEAEHERGSRLWVAIVQSKTAVSTLHSRVKVRKGLELEHDSISELVALIGSKQVAGNLRRRLTESVPVIPMSPVLSQHIIGALATNENNRTALESVFAVLSVPSRFNSPVAAQEDAVQAALKAFRVEPGDAVDVSVEPDEETALRRIWIAEDAVIEHDARLLPGFTLVNSHTTGKATFVRDANVIEVITANKRPLEEVFGIDLILLNLTQANVVMLQYKMLEPEDADAIVTDWIYRPDGQLEEEIARMRVFDRDLAPDSTDYRFNSGMFYLKFVKRDAAIRHGAILTPLDHFEALRSDPACRGPQNGFRITYDSLGGRYLREQPFLDLVYAGYIGARATTTAQILPLVEAVLTNDRGVVAAIKSHRLGTNATYQELAGRRRAK